MFFNFYFKHQKNEIKNYVIFLSSSSVGGEKI